MAERRGELIQREGQTVRVFRQMWKVWLTIGVGTGCGVLVMLFGYFGGPPGPRRPVWLLPIVGVVLLAGIFTWMGRDVCVIEPTRVGYGRQGKHMFWVDRQRIGWVRIRPRLYLEMLFYGHDGRLFASAIMNHFSPQELREALASAGVAVR